MRYRDEMLRPLLALTVALTSFAQSNSEGQPATSNVRAAAYPRIHSDRTVTFQLKAPTAQTVQVMPGGGSNGMGKGPFDMTKSGDGLWTATIGPVQPGFHYYWFSVDGVTANDPSTFTFFGWTQRSSGIDVPDKTIDFYDRKGRPARRRPRSLVFLQNHRRLAPDLRLHRARL